MSNVDTKKTIKKTLIRYIIIFLRTSIISIFYNNHA